MTREEAKNWLNKLYARADITDEYGDMEDMQPYEEAVNMAIKALEQEPCDDCISFEAVKNTMFMVQRTAFISDNEFHRTMDLLMRLPPVNPQSKTGYWIIIDDCEQFIAKCSECGRIEDSRMISKYPYCHCGARMV